MEDLKLPPYQRLKNILKEDDLILSDKGSKNLNSFLGIKPKSPTILNKFVDFLKKIDSKIFAKKSKMTNMYIKR